MTSVVVTGSRVEDSGGVQLVQGRLLESQCVVAQQNDFLEICIGRQRPQADDSFEIGRNIGVPDGLWSQDGQRAPARWALPGPACPKGKAETAALASSRTPFVGASGTGISTP